MWYEILPSMMIICVALGFPTYVVMGAGWLIYKRHPYWRCLETPDQRKWYLRDYDRFGGTYKIEGLDEFFKKLDDAKSKGGRKGEECVCDD